jgi:hypothetical protein
MMVSETDVKTHSLLWTCPQCGTLVRFPTFQAKCLAEQAGLCMNCRLESTIRKHPELLWVICDFSNTTRQQYALLA